jgi:hypothetical protein
VREGKYTIAEENGSGSDIAHCPCIAALELTSVDHIFAKGEAVGKTPTQVIFDQLGVWRATEDHFYTSDNIVGTNAVRFFSTKRT